MARTTHIEAGFQRQSGAVFLDLAAAYDTVWRDGLLLKVMESVPPSSLLEAVHSARQYASKPLLPSFPR
jgi:hypothetical protein